MILTFTCGLFPFKVLLLYGFFDSFFSSLIHKEIIQEKDRLHALSRAASTDESAPALHAGVDDSDVTDGRMFKLGLSDIEAGMLAGANAYLVKPDSSELIPTIRRLLEAAA
jgi:hypothetical protein